MLLDKVAQVARDWLLRPLQEAWKMIRSTKRSAPDSGFSSSQEQKRLRLDTLASENVSTAPSSSSGGQDSGLESMNSSMTSETMARSVSSRIGELPEGLSVARQKNEGELTDDEEVSENTTCQVVKMASVHSQSSARIVPGEEEGGQEKGKTFPDVKSSPKPELDTSFLSVVTEFRSSD